MFDWQLFVALVIVAAAAAYVLQRLIYQFRGSESSGCGACPNGKSCSSSGSKHPEIVQLNLPKQSKS